MKRWIAVDWGTTSLRLALMDAQGGVLEERASQRGILSVEAGGFPAALGEAIAPWVRENVELILMSGMVGSRQGWMEAAYCPCPAGFAQVASQLTWVEPGRIAIVPGLCCEEDGVPDVMRGEETQVFGAMHLLGVDSGLFVLPGTHSKWVRVANGRIERFATFMTGEFYALLRKHSILARTMGGDDGVFDQDAFRHGIAYAAQCGNLLRAAFSARTLALFERLPAASLPSYLSGLLIGEELRSQQMLANGGPVTLIGSQALTHRYEIALKASDVAVHSVGSQATWRGLWAIARHLEEHT